MPDSEPEDSATRASPPAASPGGAGQKKGKPKQALQLLQTPRKKNSKLKFLSASRVVASQSPTPLKRKSSEVERLRGLALTEVPLAMVQGADSAESSKELASKLTRQLPAAALKELRNLKLSESQAASLLASGSGRDRPKRARMEPLQDWRLERVVYERASGSVMPSIKAVSLNLSPQPQAAPTPHPTPRKLGGESVLHVPPLTPPSGQSHSTFLGLSTEALKSRYHTIPVPKEGEKPCMVPLDERLGLLHVLNGAIRYCFEGDPPGKEEELQQGDFARLSSRRTVLVRAIALRGDENGVASQCARLLWVAIRPKASRATPKITPAIVGGGPQPAPLALEDADLD